MQKYISRILFFFIAMGYLCSGCATTNRSQLGYYDSPSRLWGDDLTFHRNDEGIPSDWELLDLSEDTYSNADEMWGDIQSDAFDIME